MDKEKILKNLQAIIAEIKADKKKKVDMSKLPVDTLVECWDDKMIVGVMTPNDQAVRQAAAKLGDKDND